jgi:hypothetical protein
MSESPEVHNQPARLAISWLVVAVPIAYGLYQTINAIAPLFGG